LPSGELVTSSTALRPATDRFAPAAGESGRDAPAGSTPPLASGGFPRSYVIQKGDSFWGIAQKVYGDGSLLALIQKANPGVKMQPGKTLTLPAPTRPASDAPIAPESAALRSANPGRAAGSARDNTQGARSTAKPSRPGSPAPASPAASPPAREGGAILYEVKAGDTLRGLAQRFYGDPSKFTLIEEANEDLKYTMLRSGQRIRVPGPTR
jgi:nucleoid-associated protein YgaU